MNYNKIKELAEQKNISVKYILAEIDMTAPGYYSAIKNDTLKIRDLEKIAKILGVPVSYFFEENESKPLVQNGKNILNGGNHGTINISEAVHEIELLKNKVASLEELLKSKNEIIELYKSKTS